MTKREEAIEATARAVVGLMTPVIRLDDLPKDKPALRAHQRAGGDLVDTQDDLAEIATAALDAVLDVLGKPGDEMLQAAVDEGMFHDHLTRQECQEQVHEMLRAMLATLRKEG